jgi:hypothetical protein
MKKLDLINHLIVKFEFKKYLEIGVGPTYATFDNVKVEYKVGIEPTDKTHNRSDGGRIISLTSNSFFESNKERFQLIFIDGLHLFEQVARDIVNSWNALFSGGLILIHDCVPANSIQALRICRDVTAGWTGDVYKAIVRFRDKFSDIRSVVLPDDHGIGVIWKEDDRILRDDYKDLELYMGLSFDWLLKNFARIGLIGSEFTV